MSAPAPICDFTSVMSAYKQIDITCYPSCLQATVARMRTVAQSHIQLDSQQKLGSGGYGIIYKGCYQEPAGNKIACAIKVFTHKDEKNYDCIREAQMHWQSAGNPYAIGFHGFVGSEPSATTHMIILDFVDGPNLRKIHLSLSDRKAEVVELARQLFSYLAQLQEVTPNRQSPLIHCDLSRDNMFWKDRKLTVIDPGIMVPSAEANWPVVQKAETRAPEIFLNQGAEVNDGRESPRYDASIDMWSAGIVIHEFVVNAGWTTNPISQAPYGHEEVSLITHRIGMPNYEYLKNTHAPGKFFIEITPKVCGLNEQLDQLLPEISLSEFHSTCPASSPEVYDLISKILVWDPAIRLKPNQALAHPLFKQQTKTSQIHSLAQ